MAEGSSSMDLNLNLSPPSPPPPPPPPDLGLGLGLGLGLALRLGGGSSNDEIGIGLCRRQSGFELNILSHDNGGGEDEAMYEREEEDALHELFRQPEIHAGLSQRRRRWRRIRPTVVDASPISVRSEPSIIYRAVDHGNPPTIDNDQAQTFKDNTSSPLGDAVSKQGDTNASNFDCNICLDMASNPVVTSCGHLFCWVCLYQWLHVHSTSKECPVCKGDVSDANITPIYGRGNCKEEGGKSKVAGDDENIPQRPRAHRTESLRQRISRPISRSFVDAIRLTRRQEGQHNSNTADGDRDSHMEGSASVENLLGAAADQILNRLRLVQLQRRTADFRRNGESQRAGAGVAAGAEDRERWRMRQLLGRRTLLRSFNNSNYSHSLLNATDDHRVRSHRQRENLWEHMEFNRLHRSERASSVRLAAIRERVASMEGMIEALTSESRNSDARPNIANTSGNASASADEPRASGIAVSEERASVSSTNAIIQTGSMEHDSGRSSSPQMRRNGASASLDVDGGLLHVRKRRRLN